MLPARKGSGAPELSDFGDEVFTTMAPTSLPVFLGGSATAAVFELRASGAGIGSGDDDEDEEGEGVEDELDGKEEVDDDPMLEGQGEEECTSLSEGVATHDA